MIHSNLIAMFLFCALAYGPMLVSCGSEPQVETEPVEAQAASVFDNTSIDAGFEDISCPIDLCVVDLGNVYEMADRGQDSSTYNSAIVVQPGEMAGVGYVLLGAAYLDILVEEVPGVKLGLSDDLKLYGKGRQFPGGRPASYVNPKSGDGGVMMLSHEDPFRPLLYLSLMNETEEVKVVHLEARLIR